jgi:hypothetical protein
MLRKLWSWVVRVYLTVWGCDTCKRHIGSTKDCPECAEHIHDMSSYQP